MKYSYGRPLYIFVKNKWAIFYFLKNAVDFVYIVYAYITYYLQYLLFYSLKWLNLKNYSAKGIRDMFLILAPGPPSGIKLEAETMHITVNGKKKWRYTATWEVRNIKHILRTCAHILGIIDYIVLLTPLMLLPKMLLMLKTHKCQLFLTRNHTLIVIT